MKIRPYKKGDEKNILALDRSLETHCWNRRNLDNWYWKYTDNNPSGKSFIWLIEKDDNIIVHFAAVPYKLKVFDKEIIASHSIGSMIDKRYQNKGILKYVSDKLFEDIKSNIPFTYGFPNKLAYGIHIECMKYDDLIFFDTWKIEKSKIKINNDDLLSFKKIDKFDNKFDKLWNSCSDEYKICVVRNKDYLNWRYNRPDWKYFHFGIYEKNEIKGYTILKLYKEDKIIRGHIIDVFSHFNDRKTLDNIVEGSFNFFNKHNVDEITCFIWGNPLFEKILKEKNFFREETKIPLVIRVNKEDFEYKKEVKDNKNWYFTMGDSTEVF